MAFRRTAIRAVPASSMQSLERVLGQVRQCGSRSTRSTIPRRRFPSVRSTLIGSSPTASGLGMDDEEKSGPPGKPLVYKQVDVARRKNIADDVQFFGVNRFIPTRFGRSDATPASPRP